jgi:hypothetical protein
MPKSQNHQGYSCRVNILKYVKVDGKWRFASAQTQNNKLKQDCVMVNGRAERHPEGTYYIEWYENGVRRRQTVKDSTEVLAGKSKESSCYISHLLNLFLQNSRNRVHAEMHMHQWMPRIRRTQGPGPDPVAFRAKHGSALGSFVAVR